MDFQFGKEYSLCHKKIIEKTFQEGRTIKSFPYTARYIVSELPTNKPFQVVISAPKRNFKKAVKRNRIKRLMREAIRLQKSEFEKELRTLGVQLALVIVHGHRDEIKIEELKHKTAKLFSKIIKDLKTTQE